MKFLAVIATLLCTTAYAADSVPDEPNDPRAQYAMMVYCSASEATLAHLHLQVAASLATLSADKMTPQLSAMMTSYKTLADDSRSRAESYINLVRDVLVPALATQGIPKPLIQQKTAELLVTSMSRLATALSNPDNELDEQTAMERKLIEQAKGCETMASQISRHNSL